MFLCDADLSGEELPMTFLDTVSVTGLSMLAKAAMSVLS